jgi:hypothetical protein
MTAQANNPTGGFMCGHRKIRSKEYQLIKINNQLYSWQLDQLDELEDLWRQRQGPTAAMITGAYTFRSIVSIGLHYARRAILTGDATRLNDLLSQVEAATPKEEQCEPKTKP